MVPISPVIPRGLDGNPELVPAWNWQRRGARIRAPQETSSRRRVNGLGSSRPETAPSAWHWPPPPCAAPHQLRGVGEHPPARRGCGWRAMGTRPTGKVGGCSRRGTGRRRSIIVAVCNLRSRPMIGPRSGVPIDTVTVAVTGAKCRRHSVADGGGERLEQHRDAEFYRELPDRISVDGDVPRRTQRKWHANPAGPLRAHRRVHRGIRYQLLVSQRNGSDRPAITRTASRARYPRPRCRAASEPHAVRVIA